jgi:hypothetical protein
MIMDNLADRPVVRGENPDGQSLLEGDPAGLLCFSHGRALVLLRRLPCPGLLDLSGFQPGQVSGVNLAGPQCEDPHTQNGSRSRSRTFFPTTCSSQSCGTLRSGPCA